ncbi:MAG: B3/B4 domain-containing protein [Bacteroidota bacterium]
MQHKITIKQSIKNVLPACRLGIIKAHGTNGATPLAIRQKIEAAISQWKDKSFDDVRSHPVMKDFRQAYKALGADPNRYRPAADSLLRRIIKKKELYSINMYVDLINLLSMETVYSIGGFDADKINGAISLTKAPEGILYEGIGRGKINIKNIPVLQDNQDYFGSPTSDSVRTKINDSTRNLLIVYYDFYQNDRLLTSLQLTKDYLEKYGKARDIVSYIAE